MLGQQPCGAGCNEITAIQLLLERLALTGGLGTIDAVGTQTRMTLAILYRGDDHLPALEDNDPSLRAEIGRYIGGQASLVHRRFETTEGDH